MLFQQLLRHLRNLSVHAGASNLIEELDNGDLGAKPRPHRAHLKADDASTDNDERLGNLVQRQSASAGDNTLLVDFQAGKGCCLATCRNQNILALDAGLATVVQGNLDLVLISKGASTLDVLNTILLQEELDALGQSSDCGILRLHELLQVEGHVADLDTAVFCVVLDRVVDVRVVEEGLGRDATDVEAGATQSPALFNAGDLLRRGKTLETGLHDACVILNTFRPSWPALMAATYPATPPPMMTRSFSST